MCFKRGNIKYLLLPRERQRDNLSNYKLKNTYHLYREMAPHRYILQFDKYKINLFCRLFLIISIHIAYYFYINLLQHI